MRISDWSSDVCSSDLTAGKLAGLIIGIKDNICYKDHPVGAASKMLDGFVSVYSANVVERMLAEDAIIIGRLNCDELAMGASHETSFYVPVLNRPEERREGQEWVGQCSSGWWRSHYRNK